MLMKSVVVGLLAVCLTGQATVEASEFNYVAAGHPFADSSYIEVVFNPQDDRRQRDHPAGGTPR